MDTRILSRLETLRESFGPGTAAEKLALLRQLERGRLRSAASVHRLHECLCFLRAYPDNRAVLDQVDRMLQGFSKRSDLRRFRAALRDSGVAGADLVYPFYWPTADWLARAWPDRLHVEWKEFQGKDKLDKWLAPLMTYTETPALDMLSYTPREWVERLKGPKESDAAFLVSRFRGLEIEDGARRTLYEDVDPALRLDAGPDTPSRTLARTPRKRVTFQKKDLDRKRPSLEAVIPVPPRKVRAVSPKEGQKLVDLARGAMITRARDLDVFMYGDRNDVRLVDFGNGLEFAAIGARPENRLMLEAVYGFLTLKNGIPIGYVLASAFMGSSEIAYNVFETYRGGESGYVFGCVMSMVHHLFGSDAFTLDPYQLGFGNREGLESGAWWFYYKMGFRPHHPGVRRLVRRELARMKKRRGYRSSVGALEKLASEHTFYYFGKEREDVLGRIDLGAIGMAASRTLSSNYGGDRERGLENCSAAAARLLGLESMKGFSRGERLAWTRWSPLVLSLSGVERWTPAEKRDLVEVIRAKGGRRESDFVKHFDGHPKLRRAVARLAGKRF